MELNGLVVIVAQLLIMGIVGILSSVVVGVCKYKGKIKDGDAYKWIILGNLMGIFLLEATRTVLPNFSWVHFTFNLYTMDVILDWGFNLLFWVLGLVVAFAMSNWTYSIFKNKFPVIGFSYSNDK